MLVLIHDALAYQLHCMKFIMIQISAFQSWKCNHEVMMRLCSKNSANQTSPKVLTSSTDCGMFGLSILSEAGIAQVENQLSQFQTLLSWKLRHDEIAILVFRRTCWRQLRTSLYLFRVSWLLLCFLFLSYLRAYTFHLFI